MSSKITHVIIHEKDDCIYICKDRGVNISNAVIDDLTAGYNEILNFLPDGVFGRKWRILKEKANKDGDFLIEGNYCVPPYFVKEIETESDFSCTRTEDGYLLKKDNLFMRLKAEDFWEIVRFGNEITLREEVINYLDGLSNVNGVTPSEYMDHIDDIVEKLADYRTEGECGDQIYEVLCSLSGKIKASRTYPRCGKCAHETRCAKRFDYDGKCPDYKRDAPDGGFYG